MHYVLSFFLFLGLMVPQAKADIQRYTFEKPHTQINFFISHLGFSNSHGQFKNFKGDFVFNQENPERSSVDIMIDPQSVDMGDKTWNDHVKEKFLDPSQYPVIEFTSTSIEVTGDRTADINGDLTIKGETKPVVLKTVLNKQGKHPFNNEYVAGFSATTSFKRSDFGINNYLPAIGDEIEVRIEVEGICEKGCEAPLNE